MERRSCVIFIRRQTEVKVGELKIIDVLQGLDIGNVQSYPRPKIRSVTLSPKVIYDGGLRGASSLGLFTRNNVRGR